MKIPTTLGLAGLTIFLTLAILLSVYKQQIANTSSLGAPAENVQVVNLTDSSASIIWQTGISAIGSILWGQSDVLTQTQGDDRDGNTPVSRVTHYITLRNLSPLTTYYFKLRSGPLFASNQTFHFSTAKPIASSSLSEAEVTNPPLIGTVMDSKLQPIKESLIILDIPNSLPLASFTTTAGNFLLPTSILKDLPQQNPYVLNTPLEARLEVIYGNKRSDIMLTLPRAEALPPIILGQNSNFLTPEASSSGS